MPQPPHLPERQVPRTAREELVPPLNSDAEAGAATVPDRLPTPEEAAMLAETIEQLLLSFEAPERLVVELILQGCDVAEIHEQTGRPEHTVSRLRKEVRGRLERRLEGRPLSGRRGRFRHDRGIGYSARPGYGPRQRVRTHRPSL